MLAVQSGSGSIQQALVEKFWVAIMAYDPENKSHDSKLTAHHSESDTDESSDGDDEEEEEEEEEEESDLEFDEDAKGNYALVNRVDLLSVARRLMPSGATETQTQSEDESSSADGEQQQQQHEQRVTEGGRKTRHTARSGASPGRVTSGANRGRVTSGANPGRVASCAIPGTVTSGTNPGRVTHTAIPDRVTTGAKHGKVTSGANPGRFTSRANPGRVTSTAIPCRVTSGANPGRVTSTVIPCRVTSGAYPGRVTSTAIPCRVTSGANPGKVTSTVIPSRVTSGANPGRVTSTAIPCRVTSGANPGRVTSSAIPCRVTSGANPGRVTSRANPSRVTPTAIPVRVHSGANCGKVTSGANPGRVTSTAIPCRITSGANHDRVTSGANPGRVSSGANPRRVTPSAIPSGANPDRDRSKVRPSSFINRKKYSSQSQIMASQKETATVSRTKTVAGKRLWSRDGRKIIFGENLVGNKMALEKEERVNDVRPSRENRHSYQAPSNTRPNDKGTTRRWSSVMSGTRNSSATALSSGADIEAGRNGALRPTSNLLGKDEVKELGTSTRPGSSSREETSDESQRLQPNKLVHQHSRAVGGRGQDGKEAGGASVAGQKVLDDVCLEECLKEAVQELLQELPDAWLLVPDHTAELFSSLVCVMGALPRPLFAHSRIVTAMLDAHKRHPCLKEQSPSLNNTHLLLYVALKLCCVRETSNSDERQEASQGKGICVGMTQTDLIVKILKEILRCEGSFDRLMVCLLLGCRAGDQAAAGWCCHAANEAEKERDLRIVLDHIRLVPGCIVREVVSRPLWWCGAPPLLLAALSLEPALLLLLLQYGAGPTFNPLHSSCSTDGVTLALAHLLRKLKEDLKSSDGSLGYRGPADLSDPHAEDVPLAVGGPEALQALPPMDDSKAAFTDLFALAGDGPIAACLRYLLRAVGQVPTKFLREQVGVDHSLVPQQPASLTHLARTATRNSLRAKDNLPHAIHRLPLPLPLRRYLSLLTD